MTEGYFTTKDLEAKYQVSRAIIKKWRDKGMPYFKIGGIIRYKEAEVEQWVKENNESLS